MKKIIIASMALFICAATSQTVFATSFTNTNGGDNFLATDTSGGADLSISMSPGVVINALIVDNAFAFSVANANANANNRIEYAIWSAFSGYYQQENTNPAVPFTAAEMIYQYTGDPASTASPFDGWTAIGTEGGS